MTIQNLLPAERGSVVASHGAATSFASGKTFSIIPNSIMRRRDLSATAKLLHARLLQYQGCNGEAWPGISTLAAEIGVHRCRVSVHLQKLERLGLLQVERRAGYRASNRYRVQVPTDSGNATTGETRPVAKCDLLGSGNATSLVAETLPKENKKKSTKRTNNIVVEIPVVLNSPEFLKTWSAYLQHRREKRQPLTPTAAVSLLAKLASWGVTIATAALQTSVANGWQGVFEPKENRTNGKPNANTNRNTGTFNDGKATAYANAAR